jgi:hypothetical protein
VGEERWHTIAGDDDRIRVWGLSGVRSPPFIEEVGDGGAADHRQQADNEWDRQGQLTDERGRVEEEAKREMEASRVRRQHRRRSARKKKLKTCGS